MSKSKRQKKKAIKPPRRLRMRRAGRLESARVTNWVGKFQGKHIVRAYRKWFGADVPCAITELRVLGVEERPRKTARTSRTRTSYVEFRRYPMMSDLSLRYCFVSMPIVALLMRRAIP